MPDENIPQSQPPTRSGPPPERPITAPPQTSAGWAQPPQGNYAQPQGPPGGLMQSIMPTSNPPSLVSYYSRIFSLTILFAPVLSPIAIVSGVKAMKRIKALPGLKG